MVVVVAPFRCRVTGGWLVAALLYIPIRDSTSSFEQRLVKSENLLKNKPRTERHFIPSFGLFLCALVVVDIRSRSATNH